MKPKYWRRNMKQITFSELFKINASIYSLITNLTQDTLMNIQEIIIF